MLKAFGCAKSFLIVCWVGMEWNVLRGCFVVKSVCLVVIFRVIVVIFEWLVVNGGVFVVKVKLGSRMGSARD